MESRALNALMSAAYLYETMAELNETRAVLDRMRELEKKLLETQFERTVSLVNQLKKEYPDETSWVFSVGPDGYLLTVDIESSTTVKLSRKVK